MSSIFINYLGFNKYFTKQLIITNIMNLLDLTIWSFVVTLINIPFGYLRANKKVFSFKWFVYIHSPVILIYLLKIYFDVNRSIFTTFILFLFFILGQIMGKNLYYFNKIN